MLLVKAKSLIRQNWIFYIIGFLIIFGIKYFYSKAGSSELDWILAPTAWWVRILSGVGFEMEPDVGYVNHQYRFVIAPSCSGVQFMVITFAMLVYSFVHRLRTKWGRYCWMMLSLLFSYVVTIFVNGFRIAVSISLPMYFSETSDKLHLIEGTAIYFISLYIIYYAVRYLIGIIIKEPERNEYSVRCILPMFWYFFITLGIPLLNGSYKNDAEKFIKYAALMLTICMAVIFLFCLIFIFKKAFFKPNDYKTLPCVQLKVRCHK